MKQLAKNDFQMRVDRGEIKPATPERLELLSGTLPEEVDSQTFVFQGPEGGDFLLDRDLINARELAEAATARERLVTLPSGKEVTAERAQIAIQSGQTSRLDEATPAERRAALTRIEHGERLAGSVGRRTPELSELRQQLTGNEELTLAELGTLDRAAGLIGASEIETYFNLRQQGRADRSQLVQESVNAIALMQDMELEDSEGKRGVITIPIARDLLLNTPRGQQLQQDHNLVARREPLSFSELINAYQTDPKLVLALQGVSEVLADVGLNKDLQGEKVEVAKFTSLLRAPGYRDLIGGYLLYSTYPDPLLLLKAAEAGLLPVETQTLPTILDVAEQLYQSADPRIPPGFITGSVRGVLETETAASALAEYQRLIATGGPLPPETPGEPRFERLKALLSTTVSALGTAVEGTGQLIGVVEGGGGETPEAAATVGFATEELGALDESDFRAEIVNHVRKAPGDSLALRIEWTERVRNPEAMRNWLLEQLREDPDLDADLKQTRLEAVRGATAPELAREAQRLRTLALEGIAQGSR
jgi:hypothetical protein